MLRNYLTVILYFFISQLHAQNIPANDDTLNYRIVPFVVDSSNKYKDYQLEIATGHFTSEKEFKEHLLLTSHSPNGQWVEEVPSWGKQYTWHIIYKGKKKKDNTKSTFYHFSTGTSVYTDTNNYRMRIIDTAVKYKDMFVTLDYIPAMYDMKGNLVWYIPDIPGVMETGHRLRDLEPTPYGTFTLLNDYGAFEFDYHGHIIWKAPDDGRVSGDTAETYHHEFTRLQNGNYMVAGTQYITRRIPDDADTSRFMTDHSIIRKNGWFYNTFDCATLIEYNPGGEIVWSWKLSEHLDDGNFFLYRERNGKYISHPHLNSFDFDEKNKVIYASLRNFGCIIKISYPDGKIIARYGQYMDSNGQLTGERLFHGQHCAKLVPGSNDILVYNNNTLRELNTDSYIQRFSQPEDNKGNLVKTWEFNCHIDDLAPRNSNTGGSASLLPDNSLLVAMGSASRCFIVSPQKKILWYAMPELKTETGEWIRMTVYRNYFILNKDELLKFVHP